MAEDRRSRRNSRRRNKKSKLPMLLGVIVLAIILVFVSNYFPFWESSNESVNQGIEMMANPEESENSNVTELINLLEEGEYLEAIEVVSSELKEKPKDKEFLNWYKMLMNELNIELKFNYLPGQGKPKTPNASELSNLTLTQDDPYYFTISSFEKCFLYIYRISNKGNTEVLFPNDNYGNNDNPYPGGKVRIPEGYDWLRTPKGSGTETIYVIASRWEITELENLSRMINKAGNIEDRDEAVKKLHDRLIIEDAGTDDLPGLAFGEFTYKYR